MRTSTPLAQLDAFSDQFGDLVHNWGLKRIHGRIWSRLFLSTRPLDAADLIAQLGISKALVSISVRELLAIKAVRDAGKSDRGTNLFRANANLTEIYLEVLKQREQRTLEVTQKALAALSEVDTESLGLAEVNSAQIDTLAGHLEAALAVVNTAVTEQSPATHDAPEFQVEHQAVTLSSIRKTDESQSFISSVSGEAQSEMAMLAHGG